MKKILISLIAAFALLTPSMAQYRTQKYKAEGFTALTVSNAFEVQLVKSDKYGVTLDFPEDCADYILVSKQGGTLVIALKNKTPRKFRNGNYKFKATVSMPEIYGIYLSGAAKLATDDMFLMNMRPLEIHLSGASRITKLAVDGPSVELELSGASKAEINLNAAEVEADVNGASKLILTGTVDDLSMDLTGASTVNAKNVNAAKVDVECNGASKAYVYVEKMLKVDLSGASRCEYIAPEGVDLRVDSVTGASTLKRVQ